MNDDSTPWMRLLRELFGDDAEAALEQLQHMGMNPEALASVAGVSATPGMMDHLLHQIRSLMAQSDGEDVNWSLAHDVARGVAAQGGDPVVSASMAQAVRAAISRAELWLDAVTDMDPAPDEPAVWSRAQWVEATLPTWRILAGPVAVSVSQALGGVLRQELDSMASDTNPTGVSGLVANVSPTVCGMHLGQAAGQVAREAFGVTDLGVPLLTPVKVAMVPHVMAQFSEGLDIDDDDVRTFLALREAAHVRLFRSAPWLAGQLHALIERYSQSITIDIEAIDAAVRESDPSNLEQLQQSLTHGIFTPDHSDEQKATLEAIDTLLALVEGWVDDVTARAAAPHIDSLPALRETIRRRRAAGGPAEDIFSSLLGLELRPTRMRAASSLWAALSARGGAQTRDQVWRHPDLLPEASDLDNPEPWLSRTLGESDMDDVDRELEQLLRDED